MNRRSVVSTLTIVLLVILVILIVACIVLYFLGKRAEKKQAEQQEQIDAMAQTMSMLIIDKGKMRLKDADFPPIVLESTPKYLRRSEVPVVKAKVGPKIMTLMCDAEVFPLIPVKKEVKAKKRSNAATRRQRRNWEDEIQFYGADSYDEDYAPRQSKKKVHGKYNVRKKKKN